MPTVVGLFDSHKEAENAVQGLVAAGFERLDINILGAAGDISAVLAQQGLAEEDVECYAEGVRRGGTLVAVRTHTLAMGYAAEVMREHQAVDVSVPPRAGEAQAGGKWGSAGRKEAQPFGEMLEKNVDGGGSAREVARPGEEVRERQPGQSDDVYGGGVGQKGESRASKGTQNSEDTIQK